MIDREHLREKESAMWIEQVERRGNLGSDKQLTTAEGKSAGKKGKLKKIERDTDASDYCYCRKNGEFASE